MSNNSVDLTARWEVMLTLYLEAHISMLVVSPSRIVDIKFNQI